MLGIKQIYYYDKESFPSPTLRQIRCSAAVLTLLSMFRTEGKTRCNAMPIEVYRTFMSFFWSAIAVNSEHSEMGTYDTYPNIYIAND